jgi:hypothetical protein
MLYKKKGAIQIQINLIAAYSSTRKYTLSHILVTDQLGRMLDRLQVLFDTSTIRPSDYDKLADLFTDLCGQHYGSVTIRRSFPLFQKFRQWDIGRYQKQDSPLPASEISSEEEAPYLSSLHSTKDNALVRSEAMDWQSSTTITSSFSIPSTSPMVSDPRNFGALPFRILPLF